MNDFYRLTKAHRSIRKYKETPVADDVLKRVLQAATTASSSGNMQTYSIVVTKAAELKKRMFKPHFEQSMVIDAPVFLTFCADFHRMRKWLELSEAPDNFDNFISFMIATIDAVLASQSAALAAESEGLGICFLGTTLVSCNQISEILNCPQNVVPVVGFSLGYPAEEPAPRGRLPLEGVVHFETYKDYSDQATKNLYREKEITGMARYREVPELKKMIEEAQISNLAQVYTKAKYTRESHIDYSSALLDCLKRKDFFSHELKAEEK